MVKKLYAVLMSLFLTVTVLPQSIHAEEVPEGTADEPAETAEEIEEAIAEESAEEEAVSEEGAEEIGEEVISEESPAESTEEIPAEAVSEETGNSGIQYTDDGYSVTITGYADPPGTVTIPEEINGLPVTAVGENAFAAYETLHTVIIPECVTSIGDYAFGECPSLEKVIIKGSDVSVGHSVFHASPGLKTAGPLGSGANIEFGWDTEIPENAFWEANSLTGVTVPETVTEIGRYAFFNTGITYISLPDSVTSIGEFAFSHCAGLTGIDLSDSLTEIPDNMCPNCKSLTSVRIPDGVTRIGYNAFSDCDSLSGVTIPASVQQIDNTSFINCMELKTAGPIGSGSDLEYGWTTEIPEFGFSNFNGLTSITLPDSLTGIGGQAFEGCTSLVQITIPDSVTYIPAYAFSRCTSLTRFEIPYGVTRIEDDTFEGCTSLSEVSIPESVEQIDCYAFFGCTSLREITIPRAVSSIGDYAIGYYCADPDTGVTEKYDVTIYGCTETGADTYAIQNGFRFVSLEEKPITDSCVADIPDQVYTGTELLPEVTVTVDGRKLDMGTDYGVRYENNINAGTARVTIKAGGGYKGTVTKEFRIRPKAVSPEVTLSAASYTYNGNARKPGVTVKAGNMTFNEGTDYNVTYASGRTNAGTYNVKVTMTGNYSGTKTVSFKIVPKAVTPVVTLSQTAYTYDGKAKTPGVTVKDGTTTLTKGTDYTVTYASGRINAGTYTVKVTLKGNYSGTKSVSFKINKAAQAITAKAAASSVAVGKTTTVSVTGNKGTVSYKSSDTTIATVSTTGKITAKKVGTVRITVASAATANYNAASKTVTVKIVPAATSSVTAANLATGMKVTWKKVTGAAGYYVYRNGTQIKKITSGSTVTYTDTKANTNGTKYTYKIVAYAATGKSTLSKSVTSYKVAQPKISSLANTAAGKLTVKWAKNAKATGYEIQYSTSSKFTKATTKTVTVTKAATVSKVISKLTKGKTYYVRVRTYKTVSSVKYYSVWSAVKKLKLTK